MKRFLCCAALTLAACQSTNEKVVKHQPTRDLAADKREVVDAFRAGGVEWELKREELLKEPALANFVVDNMIDQMLRSYNRAQVSNTGKSGGPFERAQIELVALKQYSIPVLAELLEGSISDSVVAFLAGDILHVIGQDAWPTLMPKLNSKDAETRRRVLAVFAEMKVAPKAHAAATAALFERVRTLALKDPEWAVRGEAAATMGAIGAQMPTRKPAREVLIECLLDADTDVRLNAELALGKLGDPRSFPVLIDILAREIDGGSPRNMAGTRQALTLLARDRTLGERGRRFSIRDWQEYWQANRERLLREGR